MRMAPYDPDPGDYICPTRAKFHSVATCSYNLWTVANTEIHDFDIEESLFDLLTGVPAFSWDSKQRLSWIDGEWLHLKCRSEWRTTKDPECDMKLRSLTHYVRLGLSSPISYQHQEGTLSRKLSSGIGTSPNMSCLMRAWCYILSCRWVERLARAGRRAQLLQPTPLSLTNFWETVVAREWHAIVIRGNYTYHAPWSWRKKSSTSP